MIWSTRSRATSLRRIAPDRAILLLAFASGGRWKGQEGPFQAPSVRTAVRLALRASIRPPQRQNKRAVTRDVLEQLLTMAVRPETCDVMSDAEAETLWRLHQA